MVALILIMAVLVFWLGVLATTDVKRPPALRFRHLMKVTFYAPAIGSILSIIPVILVGFALKMF